MEHSLQHNNTYHIIEQSLSEIGISVQASGLT